VDVHRLPVRAVDDLTADAVMITFGVPAALRDAYTYRAGQHIAVQTTRDGVVERRSYSICLAPQEFWPTGATEGRLAIGVRILPGGRFSAHVRGELRPGDQLDVLTPTGRFTPRNPTEEGMSYGAVAAGSGITPIMSILGEVLTVTTTATVDLLYCNRSSESTMFGDELAAWQARHPDRLRIRHHRSRAPGPDGSPYGRLTAAELHNILAEQRNLGVTEWFLCGPEKFSVTARDHLLATGIGRRMVHAELFHAG